MNLRIILIAVLSAIVATGCSVHPTQGEVTGLPTYVLVDRIRCESRRAIQDTAIELLREHGDADLADYLASHREAFAGDARVRLRTPREVAFYDRYINTGIAFDFTLDITEDNKVLVMANPVSLITNGMLSVGVNGSGEFSRRNTRRFLISETFGDLLRNQRFSCSDFISYDNFVYPIAGDIGMKELIGTFIRLNEDITLQKYMTADARVFADTLIFTTTFSGSVSPTVEITPGVRRTGLNTSLATASASRVDMHQVTIGLSMGAKEAPPIAAPAPFQGPRHLASPFAKSDVANPNERRAIEATVQQRLDNFYDRVGRGF